MTLFCTVIYFLQTVLHVSGETFTHHQELELLWCNHCCSGKAISFRYSECVFVALGIQHSMRMRHIILSFVVCVPLQHFSTISHIGHDFRKQIY
jgi:hypothetical protein